MADTKITSLLTPQVTTNPATDVLPIVNIADTSMATSGSTRKITVNQLLGAGGTATLASATISGDLTVRTNQLVVNSTGVGVGSTPSAWSGIGPAIQVEQASLLSEASNQLYLTANGYFSGGQWNYINNASADQYYQISGSHVWRSGTGGAGGTAIGWSTLMTLNSTGLGVGVSPAYKLDVQGADNSIIAQFGGVGGRKVNFTTSANGGFANGFFNFVSTSSVGAFSFQNTSGTLLTIDSIGNVGIGVTPSAWAAGYKVIQGQIGGFALSNDNSSNNQFRLSSNAYFDTTDNRWEYYGTSTATAYEQRVGEHRFYNAISGSANTLIPFVQAMTLDASGNLLVGATSTSLTTGTGLKILQNSGVTTVGTVGSSSSDVDTTYRLYSSTASAYRFYVGYGGTVYATNTTISAISDARLKENVQDIDVGLGAILALKPRKFDWKAGKGKDIKGDRGFIAQEFEQVFPQLVDQWADEAPEGETPYKSVRQDLIPVLVKAIQELAAEVNALKNA